jgi:hypothetical protein
MKRLSLFLKLTPDVGQASAQPLYQRLGVADFDSVGVVAHAVPLG